MFISVTRMHLKSPTKLPIFFWHAFKSIVQSKKSEGLLYSSTNKEDFLTYWTLTAWESEANMRNYRNKSNHLKAMKKGKHMADQLDYIHWEGEKVPTWPDAMQKLQAVNGRLY
ncbi:DUF3291 domain-containing protein [Bacillus sp. USDA818B3_A]|uniref:DUF3291 domain-containing protein n=1 Tax=Bacillus sp. USDA818B3_A TaxID=2698834 RepID=UPI00136CAC49|nr:DUF3291 domain-containing protein [Bacillus sp. USDA818B3_A]